MKIEAGKSYRKRGGNKEKIIIGKDLKLPSNDFLEGVTGIIGKRGRGKTGLVKVLMEEFCRLKLPFIAFDPIGILWGIRSSLNGKGPGYKVLVIGGQHGDLKLDRRAGPEVAKAVVKANVSCIVDFSDESKRVYRQFVQEFSDTIYRINDNPRHIVVEEAPELVPQRLRPDMTGVFEAVERLVSRGRNRGIGVTLVSQRAATIAKDVLTQLDTLMVFGLTSPQDRKALMEWVECKADKDSLSKFDKGLAGLKRQEAWVWSPEAFSLFQAFKVRNMTTFHPDKTHLRRSGMLSVRPVESDVSSVVKSLGAAMKNLSKESPEDSKVLKQKISKLEDELVAERFREKSKTVVTTCDHRNSKRVLNALINLSHMAAKEIKRLEGSSEKTSRQVSVARNIVQNRPGPALNGSGTGYSGLRRMMIALAQRPGLSKKQLGVRAGLSSKSGTFATYLGRGRSDGWIDGGRDDLHLTESGLKSLGDYRPLPTGRDLLEHWLSELGSGGASRILSVVSSVYPNSISKVELADRAGMSYGSGTFATYLGKLRTLELISGSSEIRASDELF